MYLLLVGTYLVLGTGPAVGEVINRFEVHCEPHVVRYADLPGEPNRLKLELNILNPSRMEGLDYKVLSYTKEGNRLVPKYNLKLGSKYEPRVNIEQNLYSSWADNYIAYYLYEENNLDLKKENLYNIIVLKYSSERVENSACIAGRCIFTLDLKNYCKTTKHPAKGDSGNPRVADNPQLAIKDYYDDGSHGTGLRKPYIGIECSAQAHPLDLLSLYQERQTGKTRVLLKRVQYLAASDHVIELTLTKILTTNDKESQIYCVKHTPDEDSGSMSNIVRLREHDYMFLPPDKPAEVFAEIDTETASLKQNEVLSIVCRGTKFDDGRNLTWYIQDANSKIEVPDSKSQQYDQTKNENQLNIVLNEKYDSKRLFCAQDRYIRVLFSNGSTTVERYDVLAVSKNITLKLIREEDNSQTVKMVKKTNKFLIWCLVLGAGVLVSMVAAVIFWRRRTKGAGGMRESEENNYATAAEVTYAVLDLPEPRATAGAVNTSPYAEIIGVYNPHRRH